MSKFHYNSQKMSRLDPSSQLVTLGQIPKCSMPQEARNVIFREVGS